jgi:hypothetical protein
MQNNTESRGKNRGSAARAAEILSVAAERGDCWWLWLALFLSVLRGAHIRRIKNEFAAQKKLEATWGSRAMSRD